MSRIIVPQNRRAFLGTLTLGAAAFTTRGLFADELVRTPQQTEGPFYPNKLPLDTDNDLLVINDGITPAVGEVTYLTGRILDAKGDPVRNALVEIWQVDNNGAYIHTQDPHGEKHDKNFQGFGRFLTGSTGEYYFRTIKPVLYTGPDAAHSLQDQARLQRAAHDPVLRQGRAGQRARRHLSRASATRRRASRSRSTFTPIPGSRIGELAAKFDVVLGFTPEG